MSRLFEGYDLNELLADLRAVKMRRVDRIHSQYLERQAVKSNDEIKEAWELVRRYSRKLRELHRARERARVSCGRKALGLTVSEVEQRQRRREEEQKERDSDLGL